MGVPSGEVSVPTDSGNTLSNAFNFGILSNNRTVKEFVGSADSDDYYRFTLASTSNFNLSVNHNLSDNVDAQLIFDSNGNGQVDDSEILDEDCGCSDDNVSISSPLEAGTYFIRVNGPYNWTNTNYTLNLSA